MDDSHLMGCREAERESVAQSQYLVRLKRPAAQDLLQRLSLNELHDEIAQAPLVSEEPLVIDDRIVVYAAELACLFAKKMHDFLVFCEARQHDFDRVLAPELNVPCTIHLSHAAPSQQRVD